MSRRSHVIDPGARLPAGASIAVIRGASLGGPRELTAGLAAALIDVERRGLHIVLVAGQAQDAQGNVAAIARHVYAADAELAAELSRTWGVERVLRGASLDQREVDRVLRSLPTPAARTLRRRVYNLLKGRR